MRIKLPDALIVIGLLPLALLAGCKKTEEPPAALPPAPAPQQAPAVPPPAPVQTPLSSVQAPQGGVQPGLRSSRDPFKPLITPQPKAATAPPQQQATKPEKDLLPIQSYEASRFKVAGIVTGLKQNRALVVDPTGKGYVVVVGMEIGSSNGRITRISANAVEVVESYKDDSGRVKKRKVVLTLAKKR